MSFLALWGLALISAAEPADTMKALEGSWSVKSLLFEGAESKDQRDRKAEWVFKGGKFMVRQDGKDSDEGWQPYQIDPSKSPMEIDLRGPGGTAKGIYRLEGDMLTVCLPNPFETKERPTKFESDRLGKFCLITLTRKK